MPFWILQFLPKNKQKHVAYLKNPNSFVHFLEEFMARQFVFGNNWPLEGWKLKCELHNNFDPIIEHLPESSVSKEKNEQGRKYLEHSFLSRNLLSTYKKRNWIDQINYLGKNLISNLFHKNSRCYNYQIFISGLSNI